LEIFKSRFQTVGVLRGFPGENGERGIEVQQFWRARHQKEIIPRQQACWDTRTLGLCGGVGNIEKKR